MSIEPTTDELVAKFIAGEWLSLSTITKNEDLRLRIIEYPKYYSIKRDAFKIRMPK